METEHIRELRTLAAEYDLAGREILDSYDDDELAQIYNGAGPDSWIPAARDILTALMELFEAEILIHDTQFHQSDALHESFEKTAALWKQNCRKIFDREYPFWTWKQLSRSYRTKRAYWYGVMQAGNLAVSGRSAFQAWTEAHRNRRSDETFF